MKTRFCLPRRTRALVGLCGPGLLTLALATVATAADAVPASPNDICPIMVGEKLPDLTVQTVDGEPFDLDAAVAAQPTVLVFFRGGW